VHSVSNVAWLGIPLLAVLLATAWAHWSARPRGPQDASESVAAYEKFRLAMGAAPRPPAQRRAGMEESAHH
jgi:hypothetical protein